MTILIIITDKRVHVHTTQNASGALQDYIQTKRDYMYGFYAQRKQTIPIYRPINGTSLLLFGGYLHTLEFNTVRLAHSSISGVRAQAYLFFFFFFFL